MNPRRGEGMSRNVHEVLAELKLADLMSQDDYDLITQALSQAEAERDHEAAFRAAVTKALDVPDGGQYLNDALARIDRLTQAEARSERYEKALERIAHPKMSMGAAQMVAIADAALTEQETPK